MKISAVIPVYNEAEVIDEFSTRLISSLDEMKCDYEVIFIVEGTDETRQKLLNISSMNPRVKVEYSRRRLGLGKALKRGLQLVDSTADYVLTMDADLNHQPEELMLLVEASKEADIVVGCRSRNRGLVTELPFFKRLISGSTNWILRKVFSVPSSDVTSGYRLYSARTIEIVRDDLKGRNFEITAEILIRAKQKGSSIVEVPITFTRRPRGTSKLSFLRSGLGYVILLIRLKL
ncbi:MAG TPA: glycosyltransferase [Candidatus Bathyarchaeia archaeon]|nr:glycosyltransferase [Candidatus Bathyarchaeia archaeon]